MRFSVRANGLWLQHAWWITGFRWSGWSVGASDSGDNGLGLMAIGPLFISWIGRDIRQEPRDWENEGDWEARHPLESRIINSLFWRFADPPGLWSHAWKMVPVGQPRKRRRARKR